MKEKVNVARVSQWIVRFAGLVAVSVGIALREPSALVVGGPLLILDLWFTQEEMRSNYNKLKDSVAEAQNYDYLSEPEFIWARALDLVRHAQRNDEIRCTATFPNDFRFERDIFERVKSKELLYRRLVCYVDPGEERSDDIPFPSVESIEGTNFEVLLTSYLGWYRSFLDVLAKARTRGMDSRTERLAMNRWYQALKRIEFGTNHFQVRAHGSDIPSDYFILSSPQSHNWKAVVGFARLDGEQMQSGFWTSNSLLANDLGMNWSRLWENAHKGGAAVRR